MARDRGNRDHYDRPSWSERDKRRGKTSSTSAPAPRPGKPPDRYQQKQIDAKFQSLFNDPKKESALNKVRQEIGKEGFVAAVEAYRLDYGLPDEFDLLQVVLENHSDVAVRTEALGNMDLAVDEQAESTRQVFKTRVKLLALTSRDIPLKKAAAKIARTRGY